MKKLFTIAILFFVAFTINAQEDSTWKPKAYMTGYVNTIVEYTDLDNGFEPKKEAAAGLSEAAFLISYKPIKSLEFKGTFVYTHFMKDFQQIVVEAYGSYKIHDAIKIGAGKFLAPLSPVNQYFYAPLNVAASLPMVVSHHNILPQSITGFQIFGEFGNDLKMGYNCTYGLRGTLSSPASGLLGLQGRESFASYVWTDPISSQKVEYKPSLTARIHANYEDIFNLGLNYFYANDAVYGYQLISITGDVTTATTPSQYYSAGVDIQLKLGGFKLSSEYWIKRAETTELNNQIKAPSEA